jgi:DNA-binding XRE family transcriptional regulator
MNPTELREHYLNQGMSRRQYAAKVDVPEQSIRRLEAGQGVSPAYAKKVADDLGCKVTDLMPVPEVA